VQRYDLVVVGAGSAGLAGARFARRLGARVALVERARVGGDCTWTGCVPSKALLHQARIASHRGGPADMAQVRASVHAARERVYAHETPERLRAEGIDVLLGATTFLDPHRLAVGDRVVAGKRFLLCTGGAPRPPAVPGLADGPYLTNESVFELGVLPERLVVLGGGPVGVELAQAFRRLGSAVTLIGRNRRLLPAADPEASAVLLAAFRAEGVDARLGTEVGRVEWSGDGVRVHAAGGVAEGTHVLVALGRKPNVDGLALDRAGVRFDETRVVVDRRLRTSQAHIYAAGDVVGSFRFTHYAGWQAVMAVRNMAFPGSTRALLASVPWAIFTDPEVAQVGTTEGPVIRRWPIERNDRAQSAGESAGFLKVVLRRDGTILGATVVGGAAGETINELTVAMDNGIPFRKLASTIHVYPTYGFALQQAAAEVQYDWLTRGLRGEVTRWLNKLSR
jgi:pyruvate/2-oxoglutarate dehydrogenase complex dihydrolipoamide dehydrogenase (E3) component